VPETTDLIFAIGSVLAIFASTTNTWIAFRASNASALLRLQGFLLAVTLAAP
jgi:predicted tellurium resistance membrane protein TerC